MKSPNKLVVSLLMGMLSVNSLYPADSGDSGDAGVVTAVVVSKAAPGVLASVSHGAVSMYDKVAGSDAELPKLNADAELTKLFVTFEENVAAANLLMSHISKKNPDQIVAAEQEIGRLDEIRYAMQAVKYAMQAVKDVQRAKELVQLSSDAIVRLAELAGLNQVVAQDATPGRLQQVRDAVVNGCQYAANIVNEHRYLTAAALGTGGALSFAYRNGYTREDLKKLATGASVYRDQVRDNIGPAVTTACNTVLSQVPAQSYFTIATEMAVGATAAGSALGAKKLVDSRVAVAQEAELNELINVFKKSCDMVIGFAQRINTFETNNMIDAIVQDETGKFVEQLEYLSIRNTSASMKEKIERAKQCIKDSKKSLLMLSSLYEDLKYKNPEREAEKAAQDVELNELASELAADIGQEEVERKEREAEVLLRERVETEMQRVAEAKRKREEEADRKQLEETAKRNAKLEEEAEEEAGRKREARVEEEVRRAEERKAREEEIRRVEEVRKARDRDWCGTPSETLKGHKEREAEAERKAREVEAERKARVAEAKRKREEEEARKREAERETRELEEASKGVEAELLRVLEAREAREEAERKSVEKERKRREEAEHNERLKEASDAEVRKEREEVERKECEAREEREAEMRLIDEERRQREVHEEAEEEEEEGRKREAHEEKMRLIDEKIRLIDEERRQREVREAEAARKERDEAEEAAERKRREESRKGEEDLINRLQAKYANRLGSRGGKQEKEDAHDQRNNQRSADVPQPAAPENETTYSFTADQLIQDIASDEEVVDRQLEAEFNRERQTYGSVAPEFNNRTPRPYQSAY